MIWPRAFTFWIMWRNILVVMESSHNHCQKFFYHGTCQLPINRHYQPKVMLLKGIKGEWKLSIYATNIFGFYFATNTYLWKQFTFPGKTYARHTLYLSFHIRHSFLQTNIPHICLFWYTAILSVKSTPKSAYIRAKIAKIGQSGPKKAKTLSVLFSGLLAVVTNMQPKRLHS